MGNPKTGLTALTQHSIYSYVGGHQQTML